MKLAQDDDIVIGNSGKKTSFTINASAKAFQILSSGIYKYKIRAIVRELICNANDAHIASKSSNKWHVYAPTQLDDRFIIQDFGSGLSEQDMFDVYASYFVSTKTNSSEMTGAYGLGAKSPFSYTDIFTIESCHNGKCTVYNAMVVAGEPQLIKLHEEDFTEYTGIKVTVPTKKDDLNSWVGEILNILKPFNPNLYEVHNIEYQVDSFHKMENYSNDYFYSAWDGNKINAIYGNIVYRISADDLNYNCAWLGVSDSALYIHFDMDTLLPQPSREELQLDEMTKSNIIARLDYIHKLNLDKFLTSVSTESNIRELHRKILNLSYAEREYIRNNNILIQGKTIAAYEDYYNTLDKDNFDDIEVVLKESRIYSCDAKLLKLCEDYYRSSSSKISKTGLFQVQRKKLYIIKHTKGNVLDIIRGFKYADDSYEYPKKSTDICIVLNPTHHDKINLFKSIMGDDLVVYEYDDILHVKDLNPNYSKSTGTRTRPKSPNGYKLTLAKNTYKREELFLTTDEIDNMSGFVLCAYGYDYTCLHKQGVFIGGDLFDEVKRSSRELNISEFYIVRPSVYKRASKNDNLKCLYEEIRDNIVNKIDLISDEEYIPQSSHSYDHVINNLREEYSFVWKYLGFKYNKSVIDTLDRIYYLLQIVEADPEYRDYVIEKYNLLSKSKDKYNTNIANFKKTNPLEYMALEKNYTNKIIINDVKKLIKEKCEPCLN